MDEQERHVVPELPREQTATADSRTSADSPARSSSAAAVTDVACHCAGRGLCENAMGSTRLIVAAFVAFALTACSDATEATCREPGERYPARPMSIAEARERDGDLVLVNAALIARDGRPVELCTSLTRIRPPQCRAPSLSVDGLRDTSAFERGETEGETTWWDHVSMAGRIDGDTIRYELSCRAREVQEHLGDEIGQEPGFNAFASNVGAEWLDYGPTPDTNPPELLARYGWFSVAVATDERDQPLFTSELRQRRAIRGSGVYWTKESDGWVAFKHYGDEITLLWVAGESRRLDKRFRRVDEIMGAFAG
jgi:hypothetical protein